LPDQSGAKMVLNDLDCARVAKRVHKAVMNRQNQILQLPIRFQSLDL
jgi:hypothetical protein